MTAGLVLLAGCGSSDPAGRSTGQPTTTATAAAARSELLARAGTPIAEGLTVPVGARQAGTVFAAPSGVEGHDAWAAYLVVDGDPFAAWDDLAAQLRDGERPFEIAGSADACVWMWADDTPAPEPSSGEPIETEPLAPRGAPAAGASATGDPPVTTPDATVEDPYLAAVTITDEAPGPQIDGVDCSASATVTADGATQKVTVYLRAGAHWPATMMVLSDWADGTGLDGPIALRTTLERQAQRGDLPAPVPGPGPVPSGASEHVPSALEQESPGPGGPFGTEVNCFAEDPGYHRIHLPDGATFVAGGFDEGTASILAVDDADAALRDIQRQTAGSGTSEDGSGEIHPLELADGRSATEYTFIVGGGGGGCSAVSSPDGRFLVVAVAGD